MPVKRGRAITVFGQLFTGLDGSTGYNVAPQTYGQVKSPKNTGEVKGPGAGKVKSPSNVGEHKE
jgi:hypothetical protein